MPWLAQRADLPDTHKHWADTGSGLEAVFVRLGYVEVPAPGSDQHDDEPAPEADPVELDDQDADEPDEPEVSLPQAE